MNEEQLQTAAETLPSDDTFASEDFENSNVRNFAKTAGQVAAAAVLATSLTAVLSEPPRADLVTLPEPVPIVQTYNPYLDDVEPDESEEDDEESSRWKRVLKLLRMLAVALLVTAGLFLGALKGCASCSAGLLLPPDEPPQEQSAEEQGDEADKPAEAATTVAAEG